LLRLSHTSPADAPTSAVSAHKAAAPKLGAMPTISQYTAAKHAGAIGHANIAGQDVPRMIRMYADKLGSLHLNDNYGKIGPIYEDLHLCPSYGRLPWKDIFEALEEIGYEDTLNMEVNAEIPKIPIPLRVIQLRTAIEVMNTMRELYGK